MLSEVPSVERTVAFEDHNKLIEQAEKQLPYICIIRLGACDIPGFLAARLLQQINTNIRIVFISDDRDYVIEAYEIGASGYLLCPLNKEKFEKHLFYENMRASKNNS